MTHKSFALGGLAASNVACAIRVLQRVAVCALCVAGCRSVLPGVAVCRSVSQCVAASFASFDNETSHGAHMNPSCHTHQTIISMVNRLFFTLC